MSLILALGRQRKADLCEFKASLVYSEFQDSWGYRETLSWKRKKKKGGVCEMYVIMDEPGKRYKMLWDWGDSTSSHPCHS